MTLEEITLEKWRVPFSTNRSKAEQFDEFVIHKISTGLFEPGDAVPPHRAIAKVNNTHRNNGYRWLRKLVVNRWLKSKERGNYFIAEDPPLHPHNNPKSKLKEVFPFPLYPKHTLKYMETVGAQDPFLSLFSEMIHYNLVPMEKYSRNILKNRNLHVEADGVTKMAAYKGDGFKQAIYQYQTKNRGLKFNIGQLEIIHDRLRTLNRVFGVILKPGNCVLTMVRNDDELNEALWRAGVVVHYINPSVPNFIGRFERLLKRFAFTAIYLKPQCSFPEGTCLSEETCLSLIKLTNKFKTIVIEEHDEHEFWQDQQFVPLINYPHKSNIIYIGSLSKLTSYMQRVKAVVGANEFIRGLKAYAPEPPENLVIPKELTITDMLNDGQLGLIVSDARTAYRKICFQVDELLNHYLKDFIVYAKPVTGLSFWIRFTDQVDLKDLFNELQSEKVPLPFYSAQYQGEGRVNFLRLGFGTINTNELETILKRMEEILIQKDCKVISGQ